jgi:hypothetical protein
MAVIVTSHLEKGSIADALTEYAFELEDANTGSGIAWLESLRQKAIVAINTNGALSTLISTSVNGQSFQREYQLTESELLIHVTQALRNVKGTQVKITYGHFSNIPH